MDFTEQLIRSYPMLRRYAVKLKPTSDLADDLVQDTMLLAWRCRDRFELGTNLGAWLRTLMHNLDAGEKRTYRKREPHFHKLVPVDAVRPRQSDIVLCREVVALLDRQSPAKRHALKLHAMGWVEEEIATLQNIPIGTTKSRINRARQAVLEAVDG